MDLHPVFVHFPIALLTFYALMEFVRFEKFTKEKSWSYIKAAFVILGTVSSFATILTGKIAEDAIPAARRNVVELHETFAYATAVLFILAALNYFILVVDDLWGMRLREKYPAGWDRIVRFREAVYKNPVVVLLAFLGFSALSITGALGGIMVYGAQVDPLTKLVAKFLL